MKGGDVYTLFFACSALWFKIQIEYTVGSLKLIYEEVN